MPNTGRFATTNADEKITVRLPSEDKDQIEALVEAGVFKTKSQFLREAIAEKLEDVETADGTDVPQEVAEDA